MLVTQTCLTLIDPMGCSLSGSSVCGILQARILVWVSIPFSRGSSRPRDWTWISRCAGRFLAIWATRGALIEVVTKPFGCRGESNQTCLWEAKKASLHRGCEAVTSLEEWVGLCQVERREIRKERVGACSNHVPKELHFVFAPQDFRKRFCVSLHSMRM